MSFPQWPNFTANDTPMQALLKLSHYYGSHPEFVLAGGGNTSVKMDGTLYVKCSGQALAAADASSFVAMNRKALDALLEADLGTNPTQREEKFKQASLAARLAPEKGQRPSVESVLHHMMPRRFVVHTHSTYANMLTCCVRGEALANEIFGDDVIWVPYVDPGFTLAQTVHQSLKKYKARTGRDCPMGVLMQNHGLAITADTPEEIFDLTEKLVGKIQARLEKTSSSEVFGPAVRVRDGAARKLIETLAPALRGLLATGDALRFVTFDDSDVVLSLAGGDQGAAIAAGGPLSPDQIVYCKALPLWFDPNPNDEPQVAVEKLRQACKEYAATAGFLPNVVLARGLGLFASGDNFESAQSARVVYTDAIKVMAGAKRLGGVHYMTKTQRDFIEQWEVESYRRKVVASLSGAGRVAGKVAVITGAAQGFGMEIAHDVAAQGASVVLTDINVQGAQQAAGEINSRFGQYRGLGLPMNVADARSIDEALHQVIRNFGGLDVFISNAGVLKAGSVLTQPEAEFNFVTSVNYTGFFLCVQKVAAVLRIQHLAKPAYWSDIIQINSKSGLVGSSRNGAYAGSKFGGIGLTQSFALELVEDGIKVNAVCPGNYFDGPLWSDPANGLFVQYLRSGKVPGANTIEDVRKAYEAKIPMGRGCATADVMKAIYYLIDQKYETGQAVPVTGGQVMLA